MAEKKNVTTITEAADVASVLQTVAAQASDDDSPLTVTMTEAQLAALVERQVADTLARVNVNKPSADVESLGKSIARETAKLAGKKTVDPDVIHAREKTWAEMEAAITEAVQKGDKPRYKLQFGKSMFLPAGIGPDGRSRGYMVVEAQYRDEQTRRFEDTIFAWGGIPNEIMIPLNESAKTIHDLFMRAIAYNPNEPIAHATKQPDAEFIKGGLQPEAAPEIGFPMQAPPLGGGVEIISGQTSDPRSLPAIGMS